MINVIWAILSGVGLSLIYPKIGFYWLAWISLVPLLYVVIKSQRPRQAAGYGLVTGFIFYGVTFACVGSLAEFVGYLSLAGVFFAALFFSLYLALFCFLLKLLSGERYYFFLPAILWVVIEWLRSLGPFGLVPSLAYAQWSNLLLIQVAALGGIKLLSFLIVLVNGIIIEILFFDVARKKKFVLSLLLILIFTTLFSYGYYRLNIMPLAQNKPLAIALLQGNYPQREKLDYANIPKMKLGLLELTEQAAQQNVQLIVWPESSIPFYIQDDAVYLTKLTDLASKYAVNLILGLPRHDDNGMAYNSALFISSTGKILGWQDKRKLVPFGEYVPLRPLLLPILKTIKALKYTRLMQQDFSSSSQTAPIDTSVGRIGIAICSDSFFPDVFRKFNKQKVDYSVVITNDAWFGSSSAPNKHLMASVMRAVEFNRYVVQAANTGISAVIDPRGRILEISQLNQRVILKAKIYGQE